MVKVVARWSKRPDLTAPSIGIAASQASAMLRDNRRTNRMCSDFDIDLIAFRPSPKRMKWSPGVVLPRDGVVALHDCGVERRGNRRVKKIEQVRSRRAQPYDFAAIEGSKNRDRSGLQRHPRRGLQ